MNVVILALQGDVLEHIFTVRKTTENLKIDGKIFEVRNLNFENFDYGLILFEDIQKFTPHS